MSDIADRLRAAHWRGQAITSGNATIYGDAANEIEDLRAEVASLKAYQCTSPWEDSPLCRGIQRQLDIVADLTQQLAAANSNNQQLRGAMELAQLTLANYFEATRHMPECSAIDQNVGQVIKDALAATPDKFNPDWSLLEATQESLREHMALLAAANGRVERMREALELAHGHLLVWQTPQYQPKQNVFDTVTAALSDLPEADKEKTK